MDPQCMSRSPLRWRSSGRLDTIAQNVANLGTVGYRADEVKFDAALSKAGSDSTAFVSSGDTYISRRAGSADQDRQPARRRGAGRRLVRHQDAERRRLYARRAHADARDGRAATLNGYAILDVGRAPMTLDPSAGPPIIARDGMIMQGGQQVGAIGLFSIDPSTKLDRFENSGVIPQGRPTRFWISPRTASSRALSRKSNVNPIMEISRLIAVTRAFEAASSTIEAIRNHRAAGDQDSW